MTHIVNSWTHIHKTHSQVAWPPASRVKCLLYATGPSGHATVWPRKTHIRSSHEAGWSLGQMSVTCSWAAQSTDSMVKHIRYQNLWPGNVVKRGLLSCMYIYPIYLSIYLSTCIYLSIYICIHTHTYIRTTQATVTVVRGECVMLVTCPCKFHAPRSREAHTT